MKEDTKDASPGDVVISESHYHSKKDRVFVRGIQGQYSLKEELARLRAMPRVKKGKLIRFNDGPQTYSRHYVEPKDGITQTFHIHLEEYAPGGRSQKHGHVNEAAFYILDGEGYEIHDGIRYDWKAGDIAIVHNNCVHQHFNASETKPARALVIKTKPMFMFMNMLFQKMVIPRPTTPAPGAENLMPREFEEDFTYKGEVLRHKADKETDAETSSFCVFVAHYVGGEEYKMVNANDLGRSYEDNLVKFMGKEFPSDPYVIEVGLRNFKRQLSLDESQPKALREAMVRQLAIPMRNKRIDVIEMEKPAHDIEE